MKSFPPTSLGVTPTPKPASSSAIQVTHAPVNQADLAQWPWPQILVYGVILGLFLFGGPGAQLIGLIRSALRNSVGALAAWVVATPPPLAAEESVALIKTSDATATLHVALCTASAGVLSILGTSGLALFGRSVKLLVGIAIALVMAGVIVDLVSLLRNYNYATQARDLTSIVARKSRLVRLASICFIGGVLLLLVNALWAQSHQSPPLNGALRGSSNLAFRVA